MANTLVYKPEGGASIEVGSGGAINVHTGGSINMATGSKITGLGSTTFSATETGTGAAQDIAHGLGVTPSLVLVIPTNNSSVAGGYFDITYTTNATDVIVTAADGLVYNVVAWA